MQDVHSSAAEMPRAGSTLPPSASAGAILLLMAMTGLGQLGVNLVLPSLDAIVADVGLGAGSSGLILSTVLLGLAAGQLVAGPMSDRHGRRPVLLAGLAIFALAAVAAATATGGAMLLASRFLQGFGAGAGLALSRAVARDRYAGPEFMRVMSLLTVALAVVPGLSPMLGGIVSERFGWRAAMGVGAAAGFAVFAVTAFRLVESHHRRGAGAGIGGILRAYRRVVGVRVFLCYTVASGCAIAGAWAVFAGAERMFVGGFGFSPASFGLIPLALTSAYMTGGLMASRFARRADGRTLILAGIVLMSCGAAGLLATASAGFATPWPILSTILVYQIGMGFLLPNGIALALVAVEGDAGTASAVLGALHMVISATTAAAVGAIAAPVTLVVPSVVLCGVLTSAAALLLARR